MFVLSPFRKSVGKYTLPKPQQMNPLNVDPIIFFILVNVTMKVWEVSLRKLVHVINRIV